MRPPQSKEEFEEMYRRKGGPAPKLVTVDEDGNEHVGMVDTLVDSGMPKKMAEDIDEYMRTYDFTKMY